MMIQVVARRLYDGWSSLAVRGRASLSLLPPFHVHTDSPAPVKAIGNVYNSFTADSLPHSVGHRMKHLSNLQ